MQAQYPVIHSGWLLQSSANIWSRWRRRWCVLRGQTLFLYDTKDESSKLHEKIFLLPGVRIDLDVPDFIKSKSKHSLGFVGIETSSTRARSGSRSGRRPSLITLDRKRPVLRIHANDQNFLFEAASWDKTTVAMRDMEEAVHILREWCDFLRRSVSEEFVDTYMRDEIENNEVKTNYLRNLEKLAEKEAVKDVKRKLKNLGSFDAVPRLQDDSRRQLLFSEEKIQRALRSETRVYKQITRSVEMIKCEFEDLKRNLQHTRSLCIRQEDNLKRSYKASSLLSNSSKTSSYAKSRTGRDTGKTLLAIKKVAFAKHNLRRTLNELDMYRRVPRTVSELCSKLNADPVSNLPKAHFEYRKLVSWFDGPYHEWSLARRVYLIKLGLGDQASNGLVESAKHSANDHVVARGVRLLAEDESQRERVDSVVNELHGQVYRLGDAWQTAMWDILGPRVFELAHQRPGGVVLAVQIAENAHKQNQILDILEARIKHANADVIDGIKRRRRFFVGKDYRQKCMDGLRTAAKARFNDHMMRGMKAWRKENSGISDSDDSSDTDSSNEKDADDSNVEFDAFMAGLNSAAVGLLNDILPVSKCFPPWYNVAAELINVHILCVCEAVAPIERSSSPVCLCPEWNRKYLGEALSQTTDDDGLHLDNMEIIKLIKWSRERIINWPLVLKRVNRELSIDTIVSKQSDQPIDGQTLLVSLANDLTFHYIRRTENQILQWMLTSAQSEEIQIEFSEGFPNDEVSYGMPHTPAPRDLTSLLETKFESVLQDNAMSAVELVRFTIHIVGIVGAYHDARMQCLSWLVKEDIDARILILCALINDCDQLQTWTDDFVDKVLESDWLVDALDLVRSTSLHISDDSASSISSDSENAEKEYNDVINTRPHDKSKVLAGKSLEDQETNKMSNVSKLVEDLETLKFEKMSQLRNGQRDLSRMIAATVFSTLLGNRKPLMAALTNDVAVADLLGSFFGKINRDLKKLKKAFSKDVAKAFSVSRKDEGSEDVFGAGLTSDSEDYEAPVFRELYTREWIGDISIEDDIKDNDGKVPSLNKDENFRGKWKRTSKKERGMRAKDLSDQIRRVSPARFATETACLTMRDYMIGSSPNIFSMLGEELHPDLLALIVKELLRLVGREFCERRFLDLNKRIPGVKQALALPASIMADRLFEDIDQLRAFFEQLLNKIGSRGLRRHPVDLDSEFGVDKTFGTCTGRVTLLADLFEIEHIFQATSGGSTNDKMERYNLFCRMRAAAKRCQICAAETCGLSIRCTDPMALLLKAIDLRSAAISRKNQIEFEKAVRAFDWDGHDNSDDDSSHLHE